MIAINVSVAIYLLTICIFPPSGKMSNVNCMVDSKVIHLMLQKNAIVPLGLDFFGLHSSSESLSEGGGGHRNLFFRMNSGICDGIPARKVKLIMI